MYSEFRDLESLGHRKSHFGEVLELPQYLSLYRICLHCRRPRFDSWAGKIPWRRGRLTTPIFLGFPCGSVAKESACDVGDLGSIPGLGRSLGKGKGYPLQYSGHGVTKSEDMTERLSLFTRDRRWIRCTEHWMRWKEGEQATWDKSFWIVVIKEKKKGSNWRGMWN